MLFVPALAQLAGLDQVTAEPTSLLAVVPVSLALAGFALVMAVSSSLGAP